MNYNERKPSSVMQSQHYTWQHITFNTTPNTCDSHGFKTKHSLHTTENFLTHTSLVYSFRSEVRAHLNRYNNVTLIIINISEKISWQ